MTRPLDEADAILSQIAKRCPRLGRPPISTAPLPGSPPSWPKSPCATSTKAVLARCIREEVALDAEGLAALDALPDTFAAWQADPQARGTPLAWPAPPCDPAAAETRKLARIRTRCLNCVDGPAEVRACAFLSCPLWPFRMGRNPFLSARNAPPSEARLRAREKNTGSKQKTPDEIGGSARAPVPALEILRSWAGRALTMHSVASPDPRQMTVAELHALGCLNHSPSGALRQHDREGCGGLEDDGGVQEAENARLTVGMDAALAGAAGDLPADPARARPPSDTAASGEDAGRWVKG
jgi:hypothetical protein